MWSDEVKIKHSACNLLSLLIYYLHYLWQKTNNEQYPGKNSAIMKQCLQCHAVGVRLLSRERKLTE